MTKTEILNAYQFRHACKVFDPERTITEEDFQFILETGRLSPSSFGFEPWKFVIIQDRELRNQLLPITWGAQNTLPTASHFVLILARTKASLASTSPYIQHIMKDVQQLPPEVVERKGSLYQTFLESDFKLWENDRAVFEWASRQAYIALGNMMTAAAMIGIDSCPIEGFQKEPTEALLAEKGLLEDGAFGLACMVAFGYRAKEPREKTRRCINEVTKWI